MSKELFPPFDQPSKQWREVVEASYSQGEQLSNKKVKLLRSHAHAENAHMMRSSEEGYGAARLSSYMDEHDALKIGLAIAQTPITASNPPPRFKHGETIIQWWAPWFRDAKELPATYSGNNRPAWFKGEILAVFSWQSVMYAGFMNGAQNTYHVY